MVPPVTAALPQPVWVKLARYCLAAAAVGFMVWTGAGLVRDWRAADDVTLDLSLALLSCLPAIASNAALALAWAVLLRAMVEPKPPLKPLLAIYGLSNLGRYMPGKVGMPLMRITGAARFGASSTVTGTTVGLELLSWIATACVMSFGCLALWGRGELSAVLGPTQTLIAVAVAVGTALGAVIDRARLPRALIDRLKLAGHGPLLPPQLLLLHFATWGFWAVHAWLVARSVGATSTDALASLPFFLLSPVVGFLALLAPAGVGVREAMISMGLTGAVGPKAALAAALITRVASLVADLCSWLVTRPWNRETAPTK